MVKPSSVTGFVAKNTALTDALLAPSNEVISAEERLGIRDRLVERLGESWKEVAGDGEGAARLCVTDYYLRVRLYPPVGSEVDTSQEPFRWSSRTVQRMIGIAAARACVQGLASSPADAVRDCIGGFVKDAKEGRYGPRSLSSWLVDLPAGSLGAVSATATTWATRFINSLDWDSFDSRPVVGPADQWWNVPTAPGLSIRSRVDVLSYARESEDRGVDRSRSQDGSKYSDPAPVLFVAKSGLPGRASKVELALSALVATVSRPMLASPARVVGWWPNCGRAMVLGVDRRAMEWACDQVLAAVSKRSPRGVRGAA